MTRCLRHLVHRSEEVKRGTRVLGLLVILLAASSGCRFTPEQAIRQDFRGMPPDPKVWAMIGRASGGEVIPGLEGLLLRISPGVREGEPVGLRLRAQIRGDFEVTASYELDKIHPPAEGPGSGIVLEADIASPTDDSVTVERRVLPDGGAYVSSTYTLADEWGRQQVHPRQIRIPGVAGRLRLSRAGSTAEVAFADVEGGFQTLGRIEVGHGDLERLRLVCVVGRPDGEASVLVKDLTLRAEGLWTPGRRTAAGMTVGARDRLLWVGFIQLVVSLVLVAGIGLPAVESDKDGDCSS